MAWSRITGREVREWQKEKTAKKVPTLIQSLPDAQNFVYTTKRQRATHTLARHNLPFSLFSVLSNHQIYLALKHSASPKTMSSPGGFYKYRCKYFYSHNCKNWVWVHDTPCSTCLVSHTRFTHRSNPLTPTGSTRPPPPTSWSKKKD